MTIIDKGTTCSSAAKIISLGNRRRKETVLGSTPKFEIRIILSLLPSY